MIKDLFTAHPASVGETYTEHMVAAGGFSARLFVAAFVCGIHALLPFLFERTGSGIITELHARMVTNRIRAENKTRVVTAAKPAFTRTATLADRSRAALL